MKKPAIPSVPPSDKARMAFDMAVKERLEILSGERGGRIKPLSANATLEDMIEKVNEVIARL